MVAACRRAGPSAQVAAATMNYRVKPGELGARTLETGDLSGTCAVRMHTPDSPAGRGGIAIAFGAFAARRRRKMGSCCGRSSASR